VIRVIKVSSAKNVCPSAVPKKGPREVFQVEGLIREWTGEHDGVVVPADTLLNAITPTNVRMAAD